MDNNNNRILLVTTAIASTLLFAGFYQLAAYGQNNTPPQPQPQPQQQPPQTLDEAVTGFVNASIYQRLHNNSELQALATQDPQVKAFTDIWLQCMNNIAYDNGTISPQQCDISLNQATEKWCGIEQYNATKCEHATDLVQSYSMTPSIIERLENVLPTTTETTTTAPKITYVQQQQQSQQPPTNLKIINGDSIQSSILTDITLSELKDYRLYQDGRAEYTFESTNPGSNRTVTVLTNHGYTPAQGYIYNSTGIYTPDGSQRLVIATN